MAVTLNANSSTGFIATSDTSGVLQLQTGGTTAVTVDASQLVGIGTASPAGKLHVAGSGGPLRISGSGYATNPTEFTLGQYSSTTGYLQIPGGSTGRIDIWDGGTAPIAIFNQYGMGLYGTSPTSGSGITFPATQQASSNANTLDDYEEGTFTATITGMGSATNNNVTARYIKIGRVVTLYFPYTAYTTNAGSGASDVAVALPFPASSTGATSAALGLQSGGSATGSKHTNLYFSSGGSTALFYYDEATAWTRVTGSLLASTWNWAGNVVYLTDS
jgi:hypothetical protein